MSNRKYLRRHVYRWHRVTSMIIALPILLWTMSGFLHPVMNSFKPDVKSQVLPVQIIDSSKIKVPLQTALQLHHIDHLHNFRIVKLDHKFYYQIQQNNIDSLTYIDCRDGTLLVYGDKQYAGYLAQRFLLDSNGKSSTEEHAHNVAAADALAALSSLALCKPAIPKVMIRDITLIDRFNKEYKNSYVLLPVYRVDFYRSDSIRLYIETSTDRLATAIDNRKAWFNDFFSFAHTWSFLDSAGNAKHVAMGVFSLLCLFSFLCGFYVYNIMKGKKAKTGSSASSWHRTTGNIFLLTTLLFSFSGAWHAFAKINDKGNQRIHDQAEFSSSQLQLSLQQVQHALQKEEQLCGVSAVQMNGKNYWQVTYSKPKGCGKRYLDMQTLAELKNGDEIYARQLACSFSNQRNDQIVHTAPVNSYTHTYSMMNKRLPVYEIGFADRKNYYIETSTGYLSAATNDADKWERFSFTNLHMHHYWEMWLGKNTGKAMRNLFLIGSTLGLLLLAVTGLLMYFIKRRGQGRR